MAEADRDRKLTRAERKAEKKALKQEIKEEKKAAKLRKKEDKLRRKEEKRRKKEEKRLQKKSKKKRTELKPSRDAAGSSQERYVSEGVKAKYGKDKGKTMSCQQSIPYIEMGKDGICKVAKGVYSKTIRFLDVNYQLAQKEDQRAIFDSWCDFLNYFDSSIHFQLTFVNHKGGMVEFEESIDIKPRNDEYDDVRREYATFLKNQLAKGNNGLTKTKYITYTVQAKNINVARPKLERIEADILNNFKVVGAIAYPLTGEERLKLMYETLNPLDQTKFTFSYDEMRKAGLSTKDYIAPTSMRFEKGKYFEMGKAIGAVSYLHILAPELSDQVLKNFLDTEENMLINMHIQPLDQTNAIKMVKSKMTDINRMKIEEQKKAIRSGYDMDIIPADLQTYSDEAKHMLDDLQSRNERMFYITMIFMHVAESRERLENIMMPTAGVATQANCPLRRLDYMQEEGLMSSLPLGVNLVPIRRNMTTSALAIFVPFTTQELFMSGEALYYGLNALSSNMILVDRKKLKNPNGLILGTPGSGKSFAAKREILNVFLVTNANNPIVPMGTHIVMNGTEYVVEDTGAFARYGVDFDVYYSSHSQASAHGHKKWEAYLADSNGKKEIEVTTTHQVNRLNVTMTNHDLDSVLRARMTKGEEVQYELLNKTYGNRDYLFDLDSLPTYGARGSGSNYKVPPEALSDKRFARMLHEAEKYLGYPYVWGGSSPSTSFDCSGYVSWVINHCGNGWSYGRLGAEGLRQICAKVSPSAAKPGDLIFFQYTYPCGPGASHVGIYVGNGMMIHCGNPIQYTSVKTAYWQQHFLSYGRLP